MNRIRRYRGKIETSISKYFNEEVFTKYREDFLRDGFVSKEIIWNFINNIVTGSHEHLA
ncbi:Hypothetical protein PHPALM_5789 [Phytophthora palmivora]|uniref:Uncharacterized protein n=1 Tax=Phytophthora palmivora TaxID=4796 RepID=A0A2P4YGI7_9STRA|nr:Hypothetical protein PHPALM_5789 [Phytophthora palmivora]